MRTYFIDGAAARLFGYSNNSLSGMPVRVPIVHAATDSRIALVRKWYHAVFPPVSNVFR